MRDFVKISLFVLAIIPMHTKAQETVIPYEFKDGQPARASEINANFRALSDTIDSLAKKVETYRQSTVKNKDKALSVEERLGELEALVTKLQSDLNALKQETASISYSRDPVNDVYGVQELDFLTASVTKLMVSPNHDVTVFIKYKSKENKDYYIGLSGCSSDWQRKTYLIDDVGNIYTIKTASGIGYVGCDFINDPVFLKSGSSATFTIVFERPRSVDQFGNAFSLSIAQRLGIINVDSKWKNTLDFNVSISDIRPSKK